MLVCHCESVNDRRIRKAIKAGATTVDEIGERCGAGTSCGGCLLLVERLLEAHRPSGSADALVA